MTSDERTFLLRHLNRVETFRRPPKDLKRSFEAASQQNKAETSRIFLEAGYQAWLAYFPVTKAVQGTSHFQGKAKHANLISTLCKRSSLEKQVIATSVSEEELRSCIKERVQAWARGCRSHECEFFRRHKLDDEVLAF